MSRTAKPPLPPRSTMIPAPSPAPLHKALAAIGLFTPLVLNAATITVTTTAAENPALCTLRDAARAINTGTAQGACPAGSMVAPNTVNFAPGVSGVVNYNNGMDTTPVGVFFNPSTALNIVGPGAGSLAIACTAAGVAGMAVIPNAGVDIAISGLSIRNCSFSTGGPVAGGLTAGLYFFSNVLSNVQLSNLVITNNSGPVGGLVAFGNNVVIKRSSVEGNTGDIVGGALVFANTSATLSESLVSGNTGNTISAGYLLASNLTVENTTISGNQIVSGGNVSVAVGLIANTLNLSHSTIVRNTAAGNTASHVGLVLGLGLGTMPASVSAGLTRNKVQIPNLSRTAGPAAASISNSIVCANTNTDVLAVTNVVADYNLLGVVSGPLAGTGNVLGCTAAQLNSWLGPLANNGGPTRTHALLNVPGNPAINGGDPAYVGPNTDQRGALFQRVVGARTDMGAYEFGAGLPTEVPTTGGVGLGALSVALAALGARRRKQPKPE